MAPRRTVSTAVLQFVATHDGATLTELRDQLGIGYKSARNAVDRLRAMGELVRVDSGFYQLPHQAAGNGNGVVGLEDETSSIPVCPHPTFRRERALDTAPIRRALAELETFDPGQAHNHDPVRISADLAGQHLRRALEFNGERDPAAQEE